MSRLLSVTELRIALDRVCTEFNCRMLVDWEEAEGWVGVKLGERIERSGNERYGGGDEARSLGGDLVDVRPRATACPF